MLALNFSDKLSNIKTKISYWNRRTLTHLGKITVIKSLLLLRLNHLFMSLPNPDEKKKTLKEINYLLYNFIWEGTSRIKQTVLCQDYFNGGLRMININAFIAALKTTWLRKLNTNNNRWMVILQSSVDIQNILNLDTLYISEKVLPKIKNKLWKDVFLSHVQVSV